jgi:D-tyrosyl-tRNA(Tyr) deacylase
VQVDGRQVSSIGRGLVVLLGVARDDTEKDVDFIVNKVLGLRIFEDDKGDMNLSLEDVGGDLMVVSQFTLYADIRKGKRPSFARAAGREQGERLYEAACLAFARRGFPPAKGVFGAHMLLKLENNGPVTILVDSSRYAPDWS